MAGMFVTFEGPDGAGKTTQLRLLANYLQKEGLVVCSTREPGGTLLGDRIRGLLLDPLNSEMCPRTEALLYMAARAQHVAELILPALARGEVVISDRYADSTTVYQGVARKLSRKDLDQLNCFATTGLVPDLTILLDGEVAALRSRMEDRGVPDRIELEGFDFQQKVREGFLELAAREPERIKVVEQFGGIEQVHHEVRRLVSEFLCRRSSCEG